MKVRDAIRMIEAEGWYLVRTKVATVSSSIQTRADWLRYLVI